ncbi:unnamed protein product [Oikopleura dioica]|uniref:Uncharacterized protein n=1 Tax=Oikopleura dioica TaxID=34765 RepID=E4Y7W4_OIKDI|nr:unnamed protein product [Oikopleura dioica]
MSFQKRIFQIFGCFKPKIERNDEQPIQKGEISEAWSHWKIFIKEKSGEEKEADPDLYTRLGRCKIKFKDNSLTVSTILNGRFNKKDSKLDRQIKAKLIYALFSLVMLETKKEEMQINPRIISNIERAQFFNMKQKIKWMKKDGCEFDFEKAIFDFFQREEDNLGSVDAKVFPNEDNEFKIKF